VKVVCSSVVVDKAAVFRLELCDDGVVIIIDSFRAVDCGFAFHVLAAFFFNDVCWYSQTDRAVDDSPSLAIAF
jgi:hypothetical protein